jgi:uncharacterized membrane protein
MAIHFEHTVIIKRPVKEVYTYVSDVGNAAAWIPWTDEVAVIDGPEPSGVGEGQRRLIKQTDFGVQSETVLEATDVDPGHSYTFESVNSPVEYRGTYRFAEVREGTRLTRTYHVELPGLKRVMEPLIARRMKQRWRADFDRLKHILEHESE